MLSITRFVLAAAATLLFTGFALAEESLPAQADSRDDVFQLFRRHCVSCHGEDGNAEADVDLVHLDAKSLEANSELVRDLFGVLDRREMPPEEERPLGESDRSRLLSELRGMLAQSVAKKSAGTLTPIRRMNRFQYNNAVIDLFDLRCIVFTLPERTMREHKGYFEPASGKMADVVHVGNRPLGKSQMIERRLAGVAAFPQDLRAEHGFDNQADHLSMSPLLMESFLTLGQSITQSPDFTEKNVGIWNHFFQPPDASAKRDNPQAEFVSEISQRLDRFLGRAFRQPVSKSLLERYVAFAFSKIESGTSFTDAMKATVAAVISSPRFLYLYESASAENDYALASRLSFFLWSTLPDQELRDLAESNTLHRSDVLKQQIERMLKNRKIKRFCDSFPTQWLQLDRLISAVPDREKFPGFFFSKYRDSMHMMLEPLLLFETVLIENQPITQLIDSDFTYRSKLLDEAYGELATGKVSVGGNGAVTVLTFQRVPITDRRVGGVITNAAVMTMTSGTQRTQPITRGAWFASVIFNDPPDPPPADVPALEEKPPVEEEQMTLRERLSLHRERSDCRGCHEQIDPLGFALENYDPVGRWRDQYDNDRQIDSQGRLFREHEFQDVVEFKDTILREKDRFTRALGGHLLSFALARALEPSDEIALDEIVRSTVENDDRMQSLIKAVILSPSFVDQAPVSNPLETLPVTP